MMPIDADRVAVAAERSATMPMTETVPMIESNALPVVPGAPAGSSGTLADAADLLQHASRTLVEVRRERVARR
jgi:hypothetical protein